MKKTLVLFAVTLFILTATAAAADFHPGGYDSSCVLCQVNHLPFERSVTLCYLPVESLIPWWAASLFSQVPLDRPISLQTGRSPPSGN